MTNNTSGSAKATSIETNDVSPISAGERHGKAWHLFTVWSSPNLEFATVFIGFLAVIVFGLNVWHAILAVVVGNTLAAVTHGVLSTWGPKRGLPQMILSRSAFGKLGNLIPAGLSTLVAGIGWFAVNSTSGAFALAALTKMDVKIALAIIVIAQIGIAFVGHNLIQKFERYAFYYLVVVFGIASIIVLSKGNYALTQDHAPFVPDAPTSAFSLAGFTLTAAAAYGYTAGWTAFASDYTRYLPENTNSRQLGWAAGLGNWFATTLLMVVGAVAWTVASPAGNPTENFTGLLGNQVLASLVLLGIAVGSVGANVLNVYSGAMSFLAMGFNLGFKTRRAIMVLLAGLAGGVLSYLGVQNGDVAHQLDAFLLVVSYWVSPWIAVVLTERILSGGKNAGERALAPKNSWAGAAAFVIATSFSIWGFAAQVLYTGPIAKSAPIGDLTAVVGFVLAAVLFALFSRIDKNAK